MTAAAHHHDQPARIEATIRRQARRISVQIVAVDEFDRVLSAVSSTFARSPSAQRDAVAWCKRRGATSYRITH